MKVMPNMNVPHSNTRPRDTRLAATYPIVSGDVTFLDDLVLRLSHGSIRSRLRCGCQGSLPFPYVQIVLDGSISRKRDRRPTPECMSACAVVPQSIRFQCCIVEAVKRDRSTLRNQQAHCGGMALGPQCGSKEQGHEIKKGAFLSAPRDQASFFVFGNEPSQGVHASASCLHAQCLLVLSDICERPRDSTVLRRVDPQPRFLFTVPLDSTVNEKAR